MFDTAVESTYVWLALAVVGAGVFGLALRIPTAPPPDATGVARTVDSVASSPHEATARHPLDARQIRLGSHRLGLRGPGGDAHASLAYGPVVPATGGDGDRLAAVLEGTAEPSVREQTAVRTSARPVARPRPVVATGAGNARRPSRHVGRSMRPSSASRGQTEPVAALVAVVVVALALAVYAGAFEESAGLCRPRPRGGRRRPRRTGDNRGGVARPGRLGDALDRVPTGFEANATLTVGDRTEHAGSAAPTTADSASRRVSVRVGAGRVASGRLEVHVWT
ncbi:hypothetical protein ACFQL4_05895 [Halosimplex aquaticum]